MKKNNFYPVHCTLLVVKRCFFPLFDSLLPLCSLVWINMCMFSVSARFSSFKQCERQRQAGRGGYTVCCSFPLPVLFCEDYGHMMTAAQHNAENRKSSLVLVTGLTGTLYHMYCAQQYKQYNEHVYLLYSADTICHHAGSIKVNYTMWCAISKLL